MQQFSSVAVSELLLSMCCLCDLFIFHWKRRRNLQTRFIFSFFFFLFFKWGNREANQKPVLPKLQKESAEQRTSPLWCIMIVHTSPFLFFLWGPLLRPWSDTTFLCLSDLKRLKPRLVWYAWYWFFFLTVLLEASWVIQYEEELNAGQVHDITEPWHQFIRRNKKATNKKTKP